MRKHDLDALIGCLNHQAEKQQLQAHLKDLEQLASSAEGKQLVKDLGREGGRAVVQAADGIKNGDINAVRALVSYLQSDQNGRVLAQKIMDTLQGNGGKTC